MLEAGTGRILASASYPEFDPNTQGTLSDEGRGAISNSPFVATVEPGSVMKPFVVAALLQDKKLRAREVLPVEPQLRVGDKTFTDVSAHEPRLEVKDILRYSSNVGMIKIGERFSSAELAAWYRRFGFGQRVDTAFAANEQGTINPPESWVPQDHASATIGQSLSATALQLAAAYSVFANDGRYVTPQVVEAAVGTGTTKQVLDPAVAREVRDMLAYTVDNSGLSTAKIPGVKLAGKSGSADLFDTEKGGIYRRRNAVVRGHFSRRKTQSDRRHVPATRQKAGRAERVGHGPGLRRYRRTNGRPVGRRGVGKPLARGELVVPVPPATVRNDWEALASCCAN